MSSAPIAWIKSRTHLDGRLRRVSRTGRRIPPRFPCPTQRSAKLLMPFDMAEHLDWAGITLIERSGADMAMVTVHYGSERWLLSQVAAGGAIRILDDPALSKRLCDMAKTLVCPL